MDDQTGAFKRAFASVLVVLRGQSGIGSQRDAAKAVGTSEATYRRWESLDDPHLPNAWQVARLCEVLKCEPADLIEPAPLTDREVQLARRAGRAARRGARRAHADG